jgi:hypothetical protein
MQTLDANDAGYQRRHERNADLKAGSVNKSKTEAA